MVCGIVLPTLAIFPQPVNSVHGFFGLPIAGAVVSSQRIGAGPSSQALAREECMGVSSNRMPEKLLVNHHFLSKMGGVSLIFRHAHSCGMCLAVSF